MKSKWCLPKALYNTREVVDLLYQGSHQTFVIYTPSVSGIEVNWDMGQNTTNTVQQHSKVHRFPSLNATFLLLEVSRNRNIGPLLLTQQTFNWWKTIQPSDFCIFETLYCFIHMISTKAITIIKTLFCYYTYRKEPLSTNLTRFKYGWKMVGINRQFDESLNLWLIDGSYLFILPIS